MSARALVTGATGFIGAHLVRRLGLLGAEVHAVSRRPRTPDGDEIWHIADLGDIASTARLLRATRPDVVYHLASEVTGARDVRVVLPTMRGNLMSVVNLLTAVTETPGTRLVLAGSIEEPKPGDGQTSPSSPYAVAKWAATGYASFFHRLYGTPVTVLRVAMVYGPGQPAVGRLVPYVIRCLLRGEEPSLSGGDRLLDWVYVDDVVDAFVAAGENAAACGRVLDIASGTRVSIRDTVELLLGIVGGEARPRYGAVADRPLDAPQIADPAAAAEVLGWRPATELADGLRRTVDWYAGPDGG
ncbi:UDP-glucose 4-epimerase [Microtetraspora sp. NBRC 13810]|uniref:NAD-dependent epimerase/dehydratase family protein n=1 Tax=Microtetraspora sp. NBRC 13810 TaxID=3030990 RepID=UPI002552241E|nr:NAD-dependent epimerase/dehydratase family protein [Microtetraspora sp. NBRC 13810]GLW08780.1 UDP-glucose 4-epimerase [Microtetraspora sp. NBRC 13810]